METADLTEISPPSSKPYFFVLQSGLITSALALAGVYWLNKSAVDFSIMGWYADYVLPIGAFIVGFVAGSGYGLASWYTGVRISRWLLVTVLFLQTISYVVAEYIEYRDIYAKLEARHLVMKNTGHLPSFIEYYDFKARNFQWKAQDSHEASEPLGAAGYFFVLLGAAGFIAGGVGAPAMLSRVPYCDDCQRYMTRKVLGMLPSGFVTRKFPEAATKEEFEQQQAKAVTSGDEILQRVTTAAASGDVLAFKQELSSYASKANNKMPKRVEISLTWCKLCEKGYILPTIHTGRGKQLMRSPQKKVNVTPDFVRGIKE